MEYSIVQYISQIYEKIYMIVKKIAVYPGTFDPVTFGHIEIVKRSLNLVDKLIVGVAQQVSKKVMFNVDTRKEMMQKSTLYLGSKIHVEKFDGLLADFVHKHEASFIIRGMRTMSDFELEYKMSSANYTVFGAETIFLLSRNTSRSISSSIAKELFKLSGVKHLSTLLPQPVFDLLKMIQNNKNNNVIE